MPKLFIYTQYFENYGDALNPHWKAKFGSDYVVVLPDNAAGSNAQEIVEQVRSQIEVNDDFNREYIISWEFAEHSHSEKDQLEYEGEIKYPAKEIKL